MLIQLTKEAAYIPDTAPGNVLLQDSIENGKRGLFSGIATAALVASVCSCVVCVPWLFKHVHFNSGRHRMWIMQMCMRCWVLCKCASAFYIHSRCCCSGGTEFQQLLFITFPILVLLHVVLIYIFTRVPGGDVNDQVCRGDLSEESDYPRTKADLIVFNDLSVIEFSSPPNEIVQQSDIYGEQQLLTEHHTEMIELVHGVDNHLLTDVTPTDDSLPADVTPTDAHQTLETKTNTEADIEQVEITTECKGELSENNMDTHAEVTLTPGGAAYACRWCMLLGTCFATLNAFYSAQECLDFVTQTTTAAVDASATWQVLFTGLNCLGLMCTLSLCHKMPPNDPIKVGMVTEGCKHLVVATGSSSTAQVSMRWCGAHLCSGGPKA